LIEKNKIKWLTIAILILISTPTTVGINLEFLNSKDTSNHVSIKIDDSFDENITYYMNQGHIPGLSACIVINDSVVWQKGYGYSKLYQGIKATENTIYLGASVSKTITATAIMQLWEKGLFDLDEDVNNYLPFSLRNPKYPEKKITFRMLLSHHSSLSYGDYDSSLTYYFFTLFGSTKERYEEILSPLGKFYNPNIWIDSEPGTILQYSNIGYFILEYLLELISNQSFDEYCSMHIFNPLEMNNTSYHIKDYNRDEVSTPYIRFLNFYIPFPNFDINNYGVGGVRTSVIDLSHFLIANMNGGVYNGKRILKEETIELMRTIQFPVTNQSMWFEYGLGWRVIMRNNTKLIWHPGTGPGVATYINYNPIEKIGIIFFVNQYPIFFQYDMENWMNLLWLLFEKAYQY
jgi:CubicO group peptidase (beta-lactamase class C family)